MKELMAFMPSKKPTLAWVMAHSNCIPRVSCPTCRQFHKTAFFDQELAPAFITLGTSLLSLLIEFHRSPSLWERDASLQRI